MILVNELILDYISLISYAQGNGAEMSLERMSSMNSFLFEDLCKPMLQMMRKFA